MKVDKVLELLLIENVHSVLEGPELCTAAIVLVVQEVEVAGHGLALELGRAVGEVVVVVLVHGGSHAHRHGEADDLGLVDVALLLHVFLQVLGPEDEPAEE